MRAVQLTGLIVSCAIVVACSDASPPAEQASAVTESAAAERVVYSSLRPGNWDVYYFASAGAAPRRLTDHPGLDYDAALSPDGRWVVFTSERRNFASSLRVLAEATGAARARTSRAGRNAFLMGNWLRNV